MQASFSLQKPHSTRVLPVIQSNTGLIVIPQTGRAIPFITVFGWFLTFWRIARKRHSLRIGNTSWCLSSFDRWYFEENLLLEIFPSSLSNKMCHHYNQLCNEILGFYFRISGVLLCGWQALFFQQIKLCKVGKSRFSLFYEKACEVGSIDDCSYHRLWKQ